MDELLGGGIPVGDTTLVLGPPGAGKTISSLNFIAGGLARDGRCLYISFQDTADQLIGMARTFGWDFDAARDAGRLAISHVPMGSLDLDVLGSVVREELAGGGITRVVVDSLAEMVFAGRESDRFPAYLRSLTGLIRAAGASLLVTSETTSLGPSKEPQGGLMFVFHNVIQLRYLEHDSQVSRAVNIVKMRNSTHDTAVHLYKITSAGLQVVGPLEKVTGILGWSTLTDTALVLDPGVPLPA
jgi:circadian clock protein KaiC